MATVIDLGDLGDRGFLIFTPEKGGRNDHLGWSIAGVGDVNGDGYDDLLLGAPDAKHDHFSFDCGGAYVVYGKAGGFTDVNAKQLSGADGFVILGADAGDHSGYSVSSAGDVNGDGRPDLLIGGHGLSPYKYSDGLGVAQVLFGKTGGLGAEIDLANLTPSRGFAMQTGEQGDGLGWSVSEAGDLNGDGFGDVIVDAPFARTGEGAKAYVVFGKADGFGPLDLSDLAPADGFVVQNSATGEIGRTVSAAGDFNHDGYADLLIGDETASPGHRDGAGAAYIVYGKADGFGTVDLSDLSATDGLVLLGAKAGDQAGEAVSKAGDVNGDGFADVIVGALYNSDAGPDAGAAYVIFGRADGIASIDLAALSPTDGFAIQGGYKDDAAGKSLAAAGDVNGDGFADVIVTSNGNPDEKYPGYAYVIYGKASGFGTIDLTNLSDDDGFVIKGPSSYSGVGASVAGAGDINADGFGDVIIGGSGKGAYVVLGVAPTEDVTRIGSVISQTIHGGSGNDLLDGRSGNDVLIAAAGNDELLGRGGNDDLDGGDGDDHLSGGVGDDIMHGGEGSDRLSGSAGADILYGGPGKDVLTGGAGADIFHFSEGGTSADAKGADRVTDFHQGEHDLIDLSDYDADPSTKKIDDPFHFVGTAAFSGAVGELRYQASGSDTLVSGDTNGDRVADFTIRLSGNITMTAADFLFAAAPVGGAPMHLFQAHMEFAGNHFVQLA